MRTTVNLADDVVHAVERLRRERALGLSDAINELIRSGLAKPDVRAAFRQQTHDMGKATIDYANVWETIESADGPASR
ncbi:MAG TPA: CopG family transcriptional regulator [Mycobacterium sp.]|nr:CopG family transcriptional regulator [Mycobacterium sp.]